MPDGTSPGERMRLALVGLFLLVFAVTALSGPGRIDIVDGQTRYEVARSLVEHGDSVIRDKDVWFAVLPGRDGQPHTNYRFPHSGLGVVAIWIADATGPSDEMRRQFFFTLISPLACAFLAVIYALWFRGLGHGQAPSLLWACAGIFCTPNWFYATSTFDDMLATAAGVVAVAVAFLMRERRPMLGAALAGLLLAVAFNVKQPMALFVLPTLAALYCPAWTWRRQLLPTALVLGGLTLGVAAQVAYERYKFPPGTNPGATAQNIYGPVWAASPLPGLASMALSPSAGALWYCPTLMLSIAGWCIWRRQQQQRLFCGAVLVAVATFTVFLSYLTFFKGEPSWGPRYLTPLFALAWVFVPAAAGTMWRPLLASLLALGCLIQVLALSVDPQRLYLEQGIPFTYYYEAPWLGFDPTVSHLWQRPREIRDILARQERAPEYLPGPLPTYAPTGRSGGPVVTISTIGLLVPTTELAPISAAAALPLRAPVHLKAQEQAAVRQYHIFASLRPWWIGQQYLEPAQRPVDLTATAALLMVLLIGGGVLIAHGCADGAAIDRGLGSDLYSHRSPAPARVRS
jgi:hypothetical protein